MDIHSASGSPQSSVFGKTLLVGKEREQEGQDKPDPDTLNDTKSEADRETEAAARMSLLTRALLSCEKSTFGSLILSLFHEGMTRLSYTKLRGELEYRRSHKSL